MADTSLSHPAASQSEREHARAACETHAKNTRWGLLAFPVSLGLWFVYGYVPAPFLAVLIVAIPVVGSLVYGSHLLLVRNHALAGITSFGVALWTLALVLATAGPILLALPALLALLPIVFAMPIVSGKQLLRFFAVSIGVAGVASMLASGEAIFSVAPLSEAAIRWVSIAAAPGLVASICWSIWYENGWLRGALGRMAEANARLHESEQSLERKVAARTDEVDWNQLDAILARFGAGDSPSLALVVDDDPKARDLLRRGLERAGWTVAEAQNGRVALERVAERPPALILLDLMMPEVDGFEFVAALQESPEWRPIPIVVISAKVLTPAERKRLEGNVSKIFHKGSFETPDLLDEIRKLVDASAATSHG